MLPINVIISPHPDDTSLSIGCYIKSIHGKKIIINTHSQSLDDERIVNQTIIRKKEELIFAEKVNADVIFLDLPDTNYRGVSWKEFDYTLNKKDTNIIICKLVDKINKFTEPYNLFCPLGIGMHPDHMVCYYSSLQMMSYLHHLPKSIFFYEEIPYSLLSKSRLPSQDILFKKGELIEFLIQPDEKISLLNCYVSQLQPEYINEIMVGHRKERIIKYDYSNLIKLQCITVEHLALIDGIKLV